MKLTVAYKMTANDTKEIKALLQQNGLTVKQCKLGSNKFYAEVDTNNNAVATSILNNGKFQPKHEMKPELVNIVNMMIVKVSA